MQPRLLYYRGRIRKGIVLPLAATALAIILVFTAFVVDGGYIQVSKTRLQSASDAAALAGAMDLDQTPAILTGTVDQYLQNNGFNPAAAGSTRTLSYGSWDEDARTFAVRPFDSSNAVRVNVKTTSVPSFFGRMLGYQQYTTSAESTVVLGDGPPRDIAVVLDCSGSMSAGMTNRESRMKNTITAAKTLLSTLTDRDRVALAVYSWVDNSRPSCQQTGKVEASMSFDTTAANSVISRLNSGHYIGGTNIGGGFRAGLDLFLNDPAPRDATEPDLVKIMVVMTDGQTNKPEPYPFPDDGPTGYLPPKPWATGYDDVESMLRWSRTVRARGIKVYSIKLHGDYADPFMYTASSADDYDDQYYFHVAEGLEDVAQLLDTYKQIGVGKGSPQIVR